MVGGFFRKVEASLFLRDGRCGNVTSVASIEAWHARDRKIDKTQNCLQPEEVGEQS
jgi:hypothetical protein